MKVMNIKDNPQNRKSFVQTTEMPAHPTKAAAFGYPSERSFSP